MSRLQIEYVPITELKAYVNNAKEHPAEQVEQIKKSILEFGMNDPIAVWKDNEIVEGHGRLLALSELGGGVQLRPNYSFRPSFRRTAQGVCLSA